MNLLHCASVLLFAAASAMAQDAGVLDDAAFQRLQRELTPPADAPWRSVPWRIDLLAAQREAAAQQKPLFVWAMDGHPLGCT